MSLKWITEAWRNNLKTKVTQDHRVYFNFRQREYPAVAESSVAFTLITSADNQPGSHNLTDGWANYLLDLTSTLTIDVYFKPTFAYDTAANQYLCGWYNDAAHYLLLCYLQASDYYALIWQDGGTARGLYTAAYTDDLSLQVWTRLTASINLTTGTIWGSQLYFDGAPVDITWSGNSNVKASNFPVFKVRNITGLNAGDYNINYIRVFLDRSTTAAEVMNSNFKNIKNEEIIWLFNGTMLGHARCNVSSRVSAIGIRRSRNSLNGAGSPAEARIELMSPGAEFSDDLYAAYDPANEYYNGTSAQKYLQTAVPVEIESWYASTFECEFTGRVDSNLFSRTVSSRDVTRVEVSASDKTREIAGKTKRRATYYENKQLSSATEANSLVHLIGRLATQTEWYNFLGNASFEDASIATTWTGVNGTVTREASGLLGTYCGQLAASVSATVYQIVSFTGDVKKLTPAQSWNFSLYLACASTRAGVIRLAGYASTLSVESSTASWSIAGGDGWEKTEATLTIASSSINCLRASVEVTGSATLSMDGAMLVQNNRALDWFVPHTGTATAGTISADYASAASYDTIGFDADAVAVTHAWALVPHESPILGHLLDIGVATCSRKMSLDSAGTLVFRSPLKAAYTDPTTILTTVAAADMLTAIEERQGNKLIVHGVDIVKTAKAVKIWDAEGSGFPSSTTHTVYVSVAAGATFPENVKSAVFWMEWLK